MSIAAIFDMDGVIVDNGKYHLKAWEEFCNRHNISFTEERFNEFFGRTNEQVLTDMFHHDLSKQEIKKLGNEKEEIYREIYKPHLKPVEGLISFLEELQQNNIPTGVATSAPEENVDFVLDGLDIRGFIQIIVNDSMVTRGKPHPEIYLKTAELLKTDPQNCVVFEDSLSGTKAAFDAGTKVVAITTTVPAEKHKHAHLTVSNFNEISVKALFS